MQSKGHSASVELFDNMSINSNNPARRCRVEPLVSFVLLCFLIFGSQSGLAVPPPAGVAPVNVPAGGFSIDGDLFANMPAVNVGDWVTNSASGGGVLSR